MDYESELIRKDDKLSQVKNSPGLIWLLIIVTLILMTTAVVVLSKNLPVVPAPSVTDAAWSVESNAPRIYTVSYGVGVFSPTNLRIHSGDTVRFKNESIFPIHIISDPHPDHNNLVGFDSIGDIPQGSYFSFTFAAKGTFGYHNEKNTNEAGTIIVR